MSDVRLRFDLAQGHGPLHDTHWTGGKYANGWRTRRPSRS